MAAALTALLADDLGVWREIVALLSVQNRVAADDDLAALKGKLAKALVFKNVWEWRDHNNFGQAKEVFERRITALGLPIPWVVTPLEDVARRYARVAEWLKALRFWRFDDYELDLKAIAGNVANLEALAEEAAGLADGDGIAGLRAQIAADLLTLRDLEPIAAQLNDIRLLAVGNLRERCRQLCDCEPGGLEFDEVLANATAPELRYALLFADSFGRTQALSERLGALETVAEAETGQGMGNGSTSQ